MAKKKPKLLDQIADLPDAPERPSRGWRGDMQRKAPEVFEEIEELVRGFARGDSLIRKKFPEQRMLAKFISQTVLPEYGVRVTIHTVATYISKAGSDG